MPSSSHIVKDVIPGGIRLDRYVAEILAVLSRSQIKARELTAAVNGKNVKISRIVKNGDSVDLVWKEAEPVNIIPENIPLDILYEDNNVIIINKPQGMVVHPGAGNRRGTFANALYYRKLERSGLVVPEGGFSAAAGTKTEIAGGAGLRPGIVHRLDKDTSGVMIAAYNDSALTFLAEQFKARKVTKTYAAVVNGVPREKKGRIETFIARDPVNRKRFAVSDKGRSALSFFSVIKTWKNYSLVMLRPKTGRTHQLRVHMRWLGHPIIGDPLYGFADPLFPGAGLMLHSRSLSIILPDEQRPGIFKAPVPESFINIVRRLNHLRREAEGGH